MTRFILNKLAISYH